LPEALVLELVGLRNAMPAHHQTDFSDLKMVFALGGLRRPAGV
jgi:hypothetical protein